MMRDEILTFESSTNLWGDLIGMGSLYIDHKRLWSIAAPVLGARSAAG